MGTILFPASDVDAALVGDADGYNSRPTAPMITTRGDLGQMADFREQYRIIDGELYRVLEVHKDVEA